MMANENMLARIVSGRTDLVFDYVSSRNTAKAKDPDGVSLIEWCAYYGDVSAMRFLLLNGESLDQLGNNLGLNGAVFHGHWQLCQFLIEHDADVNLALRDSGEAPLHNALCTTERAARDRVIKVLLANGANPNCSTKPGAETGGFMRDCRTRAETPLHRAAAFGTEETIQILLDAGAKIDAKDMDGDTPLSWASWYLRPDAILRKLCYGEFRIHPQRRSMRQCLQGEPYLEK
jgi:ankyrin repeat protein